MALQPYPDGDLWVGAARGWFRFSDGGRRTFGAADGLTDSRFGPVPRFAGNPLGWHGGGLFRLWEG